MRALLKVLLFMFATASICSAQAAPQKAKTASRTAKHFMVAFDQAKWVAPPDGIFTGTPNIEPGGELKYSVLEGDPTKPGVPFTVRIACTDGYKIAPHWHPTSENVVVLKGTFALGVGDKYDDSGMQDLATGAYGYMPARKHHFGLCKGGTDVLIYGMGPFQINWIGPEPAAKKAGAN